MREYADLLLGRLVRWGLPRKEGGLPWVLPIVIYNGSGPRTAFERSSGPAPLPWERMERALALFRQESGNLSAATGAKHFDSGRRAAKWAFAQKNLQRKSLGMGKVLTRPSRRGRVSQQ